MQTRKKKIYFARHFRCHLMPFKSTNKQLENYLDKKQKSQKPSKYAVSSSFLLAGDERIEYFSYLCWLTWISGVNITYYEWFYLKES